MNEPKRTLDTLELVGGALCLDLANTINSRIEPEHDYIITYSDLVDWAGKVKILSAGQIKDLKQKALKDSKSQKALEKSLNAREMLYRVFSAIAKKVTPKEVDLNTITHLYEEAIANRRLVRVNEYYEMNWKTDETFDALLLPIIASAEKLLTSEESSHIKECSSCGWLFLDTSKNQSRRWCSMNTCGARDKMRRYHKRLKKK